MNSHAVLDINDNVPIFSEDLYVFSVPENTIQLPAGFNVSATDRDLGSNGMIVYTIIGGNEEDTFVLGEPRVKVSNASLQARGASCVRVVGSRPFGLAQLERNTAYHKMGHLIIRSLRMTSQFCCSMHW